MSGGINHIDTGSQFRNQNSERVVGQVLKTLQEKYRIDRSQFFISSKQGFTSYDEEYDIPREIEIQELI
jgi:aryl-alcohol dehydrogenase-like predicted oxidoreductase